MRRGEVKCLFTCQSDALSASRIGTAQVYAELADDFATPIPVTDSNVQKSYRGQRIGVTVHGNIWRGSVRFPKVTGDRLPLALEFIESIKGQREYVIESLLLPGVMREMTVYTPSRELPLNRVRSCDQYGLVLPFETLGDAKPVTTGAVELAIGVQSTDAQGNSGVTQRFAYYHYPGAEIDRALTITLTGSQLSITANGTELVTHASGSQTYNLDIPSSVQTSGTNIIRVESLAPESAWTVQDVTVL